VAGGGGRPEPGRGGRVQVGAGGGHGVRAVGGGVLRGSAAVPDPDHHGGREHGDLHRAGQGQEDVRGQPGACLSRPGRDGVERKRAGAGERGLYQRGLGVERRGAGHEAVQDRDQRRDRQAGVLHENEGGVAVVAERRADRDVL